MQPVTAIDTVFYYLIDLHYSQTLLLYVYVWLMFYYLIDLHYSQTMPFVTVVLARFTTL